MTDYTSYTEVKPWRPLEEEMRAPSAAKKKVGPLEFMTSVFNAVYSHSEILDQNKETRDLG